MDIFGVILLVFFADFSISNGFQTNKELFPKKEGFKQYWTETAQSNLHDSINRPFNTKFAKNVILFLGDGMGITPVTAARIYRGQKEGLDSEQTPLSWEQLPYSGLVKTYALDYHTTDSASAATAFLTGFKAHFATVGVGPEVPRQKTCDYQQTEEHSVDSIASWAIEEGKWAGLVTTTRVTHATPAALYAHSANRDWEYDAAIDGEGCTDIARQLVENAPGNQLKVILGGGRRSFLPNTTEDYEKNYANESKPLYGKREDGADLIEKWLSGQGNRKFVYNANQLKDLRIDETDYLLGLFEWNHMDYQLTHDAENRTDNPSIVDMTEKAIHLLNKNQDGYFLLVEGGRIDHALHDNNAARSLEETLWFHRAVQRALELTSREETLIVVTADHSHSINLVGYPKRNVPILGKFMDTKENGDPQNLDKMPSTLLVFANGPSALLRNESMRFDHENPTGILRRNLTDVDTENQDFLQPSLIPLEYETHGGEDVGIWAMGPFAHFFTGTIENNFIAHAMAFAMCAGPSKEACRKFKRSQTESAKEEKDDINSIKHLLIAVVILSSICLICFFCLIAVITFRYFINRNEKKNQNAVWMKNYAFEGVQ